MCLTPQGRMVSDLASGSSRYCICSASGPRNPESEGTQLRPKGIEGKCFIWAVAENQPG